MIIDILLALGLGFILIQVFRRKLKHPYRFLGGWLALSLMIDTISIALKQKNALFPLLYLLLIAFWILTYVLIKQERRRLLIGLMTNLASVFTVLYISYLGVQFASLLMIALFVSLGIISIFILSFGIYALIFFLFWNAKQVLKKENRTTANLLSFFIGIFFVLLLIFNVINRHFSYTSLLNSLYTTIILIVIYFLINFITFLTSSLIFYLLKPEMNQDFLIVLGAGLIDGKRVTPLLASRIDTAIYFMNQQFKLTQKQALLIMSGGQGADEKIPESVAMKNYAIQKGVSPENILIEDKSTTTLENLEFSKQIMENLKGKSYESSFVSNDYHIFRAGLFAKKIDLKSYGIGAKTAKYFIPNALIREFIAITVMHKKRHIVMIMLIVLFVLTITILNRFFS